MTIVATAGHVDHGKTSLVHALTGIDTDRLPDETARGLTIDLGFAHLDTEGHGDGDGNGDGELSFVDVPGHIRFIRNMLAGVGATDVALLVVAADDGWMPQTEEHLSILELLGVGQGMVALTKVDLVTDERRAECRSMLARRLAGTFLDGAPVVDVSTRTGEGTDLLLAELRAAAARTVASPDRRRPRMWIDRSFSRRGSGTVVTGTVTGGSFAVGDALAVQPDGTPCTIRRVQRHGRDRPRVGPGERAALNIAHVDLSSVGRGRVVVEPRRWLATSTVDATLSVLAGAPAPVKRRGAHLLYIGTGEWTAQLRILGTDEIEPGGHGLVRLHLPTALPLFPGDRYVLRDAGRSATVGGGEVLDIAPVLPASRARPDRRVDRVVSERGWILVDDLEILTGDRRTATVGGWVVDPDALRAAVASLSSRVTEAGASGIELGTLGDHDRAIVEAGLLGDDAVVESGWMHPADRAADPIEHPWLAAAAATPFNPPPPDGISVDELRQLHHRKLVVRRDGIVFHHSAVDLATVIVRTLVTVHPQGFTVAQARDAFGSSRRGTLPILAELDARGITHRVGDVRTAGPHLSG